MMYLKVYVFPLLNATDNNGRVSWVRWYDVEWHKTINESNINITDNAPYCIVSITRFGEISAYTRDDYCTWNFLSFQASFSFSARC